LTDTLTSPPRPRLTLCVAVSGHRPKPDRFSREAFASVAASLDEVLGSIAATAESFNSRVLRIEGEALTKEAPRIFADSRPLVRLFTSLAEGADQLAVAAVERRRAIDRVASSAEWRIEAVLPAARAHYIRSQRQSADGSGRDVSEDIEAAITRADRVFELPSPRYATEIVHSEFPPVNIGQAVPKTELIARDDEQPPRPQPNFAYSADFLAEQADFLIAIWDGDTEGPLPGGTAWQVERARKAGMPVIEISTKSVNAGAISVTARHKPHAPGPADWRASLIAVLSTIYLPDLARPRLKRHSRSVEGWQRSGGVGWWWLIGAVWALLDALLGVICTVLGSGQDSHGSGDKRSHAIWLRRFYEAKWQQEHVPITFDLLKRRHQGAELKGRIDFDTFDKKAEDWLPFTTAQVIGNLLDEDIRTILLPRFFVADRLATFYAHKYRSAYLTMYAFSLLAVFFALLGFLLPAAGEVGYLYLDPVILKGGLVLIESFLIWRIIALHHNGQREHWHLSWVDYRALAENLRYLRFLSPLGLQTQNAREEDAGTRWWLWYLRATARELTLPSTAMVGQQLLAFLRAVRRSEFDNQIQYHRSTSETFYSIDQWLHTRGSLSFQLTFLLLILGLAGVVVYAVIVYCPFFDEPTRDAAERLAHGIKPTFGIIVALLPAIGAALSGIRYNGDFRPAAERYGEMVRALMRLKWRTRGLMWALAREPIPSVVDSEAFRLSRELMLDTARAMAEDVDAFDELYGRKSLDLPG
jgi:hypothetical protein